MNVSRRGFLSVAAGATVAGLAGCAAPWRQQREGSSAPAGSEGSAAEPEIDLREFAALELDMDAWSYDEQNGCWYQLGIPYCTKPATETYESLAIYVPGAYLEGKKHGRAYRCTVAADATVGSFTPATAPVVMPLNSASYEAQACPTSYSYNGLARYLAAGFVYVYAGFRGRSSTVESTSSSDMIAGGAPWALVDLKAAVRYLRYNKDLLPCDTDQIYTFGFGGGGGLSASLGSMGDAAAYDDYLASIGAATHDGVEGAGLSDAIAGSASWCPQTSFELGDAGYEWMMGQFAADGERADGTWTRLLSADLAAAYGKQLNDLALVDADGNALALDPAEDGSYVSGSYYDYIIKLVEDSASAFLSGTSFPYTYTPALSGTPTFPGDPNLTEENAAEGDAGVDAGGESGDGAASGGAATDVSAAGTAAGAATDASATDADVADAGAGATDPTASDAGASNATATEAGASGASVLAEAGAAGTGVAASPVTAASPLAAAAGISGVTTVQSTVYDSIESYVATLNGGTRWLTYNPRQQTADVTDLWDFVRVCRPATRGVAAYDSHDRSTEANQLFGIGDESTLHFDATISELVSQGRDRYAQGAGWDAAYISDWAGDLAKTDSLDTDMATRCAMTDPLFYLSERYEGYGHAHVAPHWRINAGVFSSESPLTTEANLALALSNTDGVKDVAFNCVWGAGYGLAEQTGNATDNLIAWVTSCAAPQQG